MPKITFVNADGSHTAVNADVGRTLMENAVSHGITGIVAECGGACQCATCHVYVAEPWSQRLPPISADEDVMLENTVAPRRPESRLSCQIEVKPEYDGLVALMPDRQI